MKRRKAFEGMKKMPQRQRQRVRGARRNLKEEERRQCVKDVCTACRDRGQAEVVRSWGIDSR